MTTASQGNAFCWHKAPSTSGAGSNRITPITAPNRPTKRLNLSDSSIPRRLTGWRGHGRRRGRLYENL